jgi:hypothetical protein
LGQSSENLPQPQERTQLDEKWLWPHDGHSIQWQHGYGQETGTNFGEKWLWPKMAMAMGQLLDPMKKWLPKMAMAMGQLLDPMKKWLQPGDRD